MTARECRLQAVAAVAQECAEGINDSSIDNKTGRRSDGWWAGAWSLGLQAAAALCPPGHLHQSTEEMLPGQVLL